MKKCGITLEDRRVHESPLHDLVNLNVELAFSENYLLECDELCGAPTTNLIIIPRSKGCASFERRARTTKWIDDVLLVLAENEDNKDKALMDLVCHLSRTEMCQTKLGEDR